jgi:hypothetical protein
MRRWWIAGVIAAATLLAESPTSTVRELIETVRAGLHAKESDGAVAKSIRKLKLSERLNDEAIEVLEEEGAGPKTAAELAALRDESEELDPPAHPLPFEHPEQPSSEEIRQLVADFRHSASSYSKSLPDFICEETVDRSQQFGGSWRHLDALEFRLTFFQQHEDYKLLNVNGRPRTGNMEEVGGAISKGEFGSILYLLVGYPATFRWDHWTILRHRPAHVFAFRVSGEYAPYHIQFQSGRAGMKHAATVGQSGWIYVDKETKGILRLVADAIDVPKSFPIQKSRTTVDYDFTEVGSNPYLLPIHAEVRMAGPIITRNEVKFRGYRKFGAETTITFGQ